ncbi:MAG: potassium transporter TrkG, partial [Planctomycetota bacterium]
PAEVTSAIFGVFTLYLATLVVGSVVLTALPGIDILTATSASATCLGGVGPGLAKVGAAQNFSWMPDAGKVVCCVMMLLGRLEFFTLLALLMPATWRR